MVSDYAEPKAVLGNFPWHTDHNANTPIVNFNFHFKLWNWIFRHIAHTDAVQKRMTFRFIINKFDGSVFHVVILIFFAHR